VDALSQSFEERLQEIEAYLDFLQAVEHQVQRGLPRIGDVSTLITAQQQKILYSGVFLQLYNLVEATVTRCVDAVSDAVAEDGRWRPGDLSAQLRREWVRFTARTHVDLSYDNRLESALALCDRLINVVPLSPFTIQKGGGGNWDENRIEDMSNRLGLRLRISHDAYSAVKRHFRNDRGALASIKNYRNGLAHGSLSFTECGEGITVRELSELKDVTARYLREVVISFQIAIEAYEFLDPRSRPIEAAS